jgi:hypothetical protein
MSLVREYISFERGSDPKKILDISSKHYILDYANKHRNEISKRDLLKFTDKYTKILKFNLYNIIDTNKLIELYFIIKILGIENVKVLCLDDEDYKGEEPLFKKIVNPWLDKGWEIWLNVESMSKFIAIQYYILVKYD